MTLNLEAFPLPDNILEDASIAFFKGDTSGVTRDYALLEDGQTIGDGYTATESTDAERLEKAAINKPRIFIKMPADEA